jgi:hypothetical protein
MLTPPEKSLSISGAAGQAQLSKGQKTFNSLIRQIEQCRTRLAAWEIAIPRYQQKHSSELQPLFDQAQALEIKTVHALDQAHGRTGLTQNERRKISRVITDMTEALIAATDDATLKELFNKHGGGDYDELQAGGEAAMKAAMEQLLGVDLGDDIDLSSPDRFMEQLGEKMLDQRKQEEAARAAEQEIRSRRKKTAKQMAREAREHADQQQLRQSIREIYRKLASTLHPDRETDARERERKTGLMQRVNEAYSKNNLLLLLELQLELEQIDQAHINNVGEDRLKHYNTILREQLGELRQEMARVEISFAAQFMLDPYTQRRPETVLSQLAIEIANTRHDIRSLQNQLRTIENVKLLKAWLKSLRVSRGRDQFDDMLF